VQNYFLIITGKNSSEVSLITETIAQLDLYYLSFFHFVCQEFAGDMVQLQVELEPASNMYLAMKEIIAHLSRSDYFTK